MIFAALFFIFGSFKISGYPYEILKDSIFERYFLDGTSEKWEDIWIKILSREGSKEFSSLYTDYSPLYNSAKFEIIEVINENGQRDTIPIKNVKDVPAPPELGGTIFWGDRNLIVQIPSPPVGSIVHYRIFKKGGNWLGPTEPARKEKNIKYRTPYPGFFNTILLFEDNVPIVKKIYVLENNPQKPVKFGIYNGQIKHKKFEENGKTYHVFWVDSVPAAPSEKLAGSDYDNYRKLIVTNIPDWQTMSKHDYQLAEPNVRPDSIIKTFTDSLLKGITEDSSKIYRLFRFVADEIRYLGLIEAQAEGYEPHRASLTLLHREGVCKDKAGLLVSLLRAAGFSAYYTTTGAFIRVEDIPADQTNHAIVALETSPFHYIYLDPTMGAFGKEIFPPFEEGQQVLVARKEGDKLRTIPLSNPDKNGVDIDLQETLIGDSSLVIITFKAKRGVDQSFRRKFKDKSYKDIVRMITSELGSDIKVDTVIYSNPGDYSHFFTYKVRFRRYNVLKKLGKYRLFKPFILKDLLTYGIWELNFVEPDSKRRFPFNFVMTKSTTLKETVKIKGPYKIYALPEPVNFKINTKPYTTTLMTESKGGFLSITLKIGKRKFSPEEYKKLSNLKKVYKEFEKQWIILEEIK